MGTESSSHPLLVLERYLSLRCDHKDLVLDPQNPHKVKYDRTHPSARVLRWEVEREESYRIPWAS